MVDTREIYKNRINIGVFGLVVNRFGSVFTKEKILLVSRKNYPWSGFYSLPGGSVNFDESLEDALKREIKEETNIEVEIIKPSKFYHTYSEDFLARFIGLVFHCTYRSGRIQPNRDELYDARFFSREEICKLKLAPVTKQILRCELGFHDLDFTRDEYEFLKEK